MLPHRFNSKFWIRTNHILQEVPLQYKSHRLSNRMLELICKTKKILRLWEDLNHLPTVVHKLSNFSSLRYLTLLHNRWKKSNLKVILNNSKYKSLFPSNRIFPKFKFKSKIQNNKKLSLKTMVSTMIPWSSQTKAPSMITSLASKSVKELTQLCEWDFTNLQIRKLLWRFIKSTSYWTQTEENQSREKSN